MDKLLALNMFVETVRCGGFSAAARKLAVATSSVMRQVAGLEAELGTVLLHRSTRHCSPTEAGQAYFAHGVAILQALQHADDAVADRDNGVVRGHLRISVPVEFGRRVIAPHLQQLLDAHPELQISLSLSDAVADLYKERVDVAVRLGSTTPTDEVVCRPVGQFQRWLVASPDYLQRQPLPRLPEDLLQHACLRYDYGSGAAPWWFRQGGQAVPVAVSGRLLSNNADVLRVSALAGQGIALLADWLVAQDVGDGRLVRLLADYQANPGSADTSINLFYLTRHRGSRRLNAFIRFLEGLLAA